MFNCSTCGASKKSQQRLSRHIKDHHGVQVTCPLCSRYQVTPRSMARMKRHLTHVHRVDPNKYFHFKSRTSAKSNTDSIPSLLSLQVETPIAYQLQTPQKKTLQISQTESAQAAHSTARTSIVSEDTYRPHCLTPEYPQATTADDLFDLPKTFSPLLEAISMPSPAGPVSKSPALHSDIADLMKSCEAVTPLGKDSSTPSAGSVSPPNPPTPKDPNDVPSDDLESPGISMEMTEKGLTLNICPSTVTVAPAAFAEPPPVQRVAPKKSLPKFKSKSCGHKSSKSETKNKPPIKLIPLAIPAVTREDPDFHLLERPVQFLLTSLPCPCASSTWKPRSQRVATPSICSLNV